MKRLATLLFFLTLTVLLSGCPLDKYIDAVKGVSYNT